MKKYTALLIAILSVTSFYQAMAQKEEQKIVNFENISLYRKNDVNHPLVCGEGKDFPEGAEYLVYLNDDKKVMHIVFPDKDDAPKDFSEDFQIKGFSQYVKKLNNYKIKTVESKYKYFVVAEIKN